MTDDHEDKRHAEEVKALARGKARFDGYATVDRVWYNNVRLAIESGAPQSLGQLLDANESEDAAMNAYLWAAFERGWVD